MTNRKLPKHLETIINEACWGVPGVGQLTGEAKLRAILEAAWEVAEHRPEELTHDLDHMMCTYCRHITECWKNCPHRKLGEPLSSDMDDLLDTLERTLRP